MPKLTVLPSGASLDVAVGTNLMEAIQKLGLPIGSSCGAIAVCAKCGVEIVGGHENLSPATALEEKLLARDHLGKSVRLTCITRIHGDVTVKASYW
ncbi:MAG: (2Fe-2S)-binding protein [Oligoflexia bacterium]|nr:(2Fe-2S)-binding protein [Oligoflexia bacterium]